MADDDASPRYMKWDPSSVQFLDAYPDVKNPDMNQPQIQEIVMLNEEGKMEALVSSFLWYLFIYEKQKWSGHCFRRCCWSKNPTIWLADWRTLPSD